MPDGLITWAKKHNIAIIIADGYIVSAWVMGIGMSGRDRVWWAGGYPERYV